MASASTAVDAALDSPFVHFTVLYRLRQRAKSLTLPHAVNDHPSSHLQRYSMTDASASQRRYSVASAPSLPPRDVRRPSLIRATVHRDHDTTLPLHEAHAQRQRTTRALSVPSLRPPFAATAEIVDTAAAVTAANADSYDDNDRSGMNGCDRQTNSPSAPQTPTTQLLSTMDKRELSKIVLRDAVYAQLLDVVPNRQHVQTAVWTLSETMVQFDGAVAVRPMFEAEQQAVVYGDDEAVHARLRQRVKDMITDASFFAAVLRPYLGEWACSGDIELAQVDGVTV